MLQYTLHEVIFYCLDTWHRIVIPLQIKHLPSDKTAVDIGQLCLLTWL